MPQVAGWTAPVMVWNGDYSQSSMVVDRHGHVHIAARGDSGIWYITNRTGTWTRARLTQDVANTYGKVTDTDPHIALDRSDGSLTVVYTRTTPRDYIPQWTLRYITNRSGGWSSPRDIPGMWAQSVVVRNGAIAIATPVVVMCCVGDFHAASFVTNASGHWTTASVGTPTHDSSRTPYALSLALDSQGKPRLVFVKDDRVRYARGTTKLGSFVYETVATVNVVDSIATSIALDGQDRPRIAYANGAGTRFASRDASGWQIRSLTGFASEVTDVRLVIDGGGHPCLALAMGPAGLGYFTKSGGAWHSQRLDARPVRVLGGLALGPNGRVNVLYQRGQTTPRLWFTHST